MSQVRMRLMMLGVLTGIGALFFIIAFGGLTLLASKSQMLVELKQQSKTVDAQSANLAAAKKQVEQYAYFNDVAKTVLPSDKDQAQAVIDIFNLAEQSGISIASVTFPASSLGTKPTTTPSSTSTSGNDAATASSQSAISQAKPVEGIAGLYSLQLNISAQSGAGVPDAKKVTYPKFLDFLSRIENNRRTAQIINVNIQPQTGDSGPGQFINFTLAINIFMKP